MSNLDRAAHIAQRCNFKRFQVGAVLVDKNGHVLSQGWAHVPETRLTTALSMHAEIHALARAKHVDLRGTFCFVATISRKSGNRTNSRPCATCAVALRAAGVVAAVYTTGNETHETLDLEAPFYGLKLYQAERRQHAQ